MPFNREEVDKAVKEQELTTTKMCQLYNELCETMHPKDAFQTIFLAWANIAMQVRDGQPKFYEAFNKNIIPEVLSLILNTNRDIIALILIEQITEEFDKLKN